MRLVCPECGGQFSIAACLSDASAREAVAAALKLPNNLGDRILRYIALFRPRKRGLSWDRAAKLLVELQGPINAAQVERNGEIYSAPLEVWKPAFDQMLAAKDRLQLPLKSHGYLFEIIVGMSQKAAGRREIDYDAELRHRQRTGAGLKPLSARMDEGQKESKRADLRAALKGKVNNHE